MINKIRKKKILLPYFVNTVLPLFRRVQLLQGLYTISDGSHILVFLLKAKDVGCVQTTHPFTI